MADNMITFSVRGLDKQLLHLGKIAKGLRPGLRKALRKASGHLKRRIKVNLSGRVLNVRTGRLRSSLEIEERATIGGHQIELGYDLKRVVYARIHEMGGFAGRGRTVKIPKRPYLRRALVEKKVVIRSVLRDFVTKLMRH